MVRYVEDLDKAAWQLLDHALSDAVFYEKVRNRQGYVCVCDGRIIGILRFNLFWDTIPFCTLLRIEDALQGHGFGRQLMERWEHDMKCLGYRLCSASAGHNRIRLAPQGRTRRVTNRSQKRFVRHGMVMTSTQVDEDAQHFYRKLGYKDAGGFVVDVPGYEQPMEMIMIKAVCLS